MTVTPTKADITNTVSVNGNIENDPSTVVKATGAGEVNYIAVSDGTYVEAGAMILQIRGQNESNPNTDDTDDQQTPTYTYTDITAPPVAPCISAPYSASGSTSATNWEPSPPPPIPLWQL